MNYKDTAEQYVREKLPELGGEHRGVMKNDEIEFTGHPIQLQHWLRVLEKCPFNYVNQGEWLGIYNNFDDTEEMTFNLTTGQPATEADYKAFCEIVGLDTNNDV